MSAVWTSPLTWVVGQLVSATNLNEQLRDNLEFLYSPARDAVQFDATADFTTTSTSFVDATGFVATLTTSGRRVRIIVLVPWKVSSAAALVRATITRDAVTIGGTDGIWCGNTNLTTISPSMAFVFYDEPDAGAHTYQLQVKTSAGTLTIWKGATAGDSYKSTFEAIEMG